MLSTEIIKWAIEEFKPEGFGLYNNGTSLSIEIPCDRLIRMDGKYWNSDEYKNTLTVYYPLFLQRVIEGINSNSENILIDQSSTSVQTRIEINGGETTEFNTFPIQLARYDRAKELAIEYIYKELHK